MKDMIPDPKPVPPFWLLDKLAEIRYTGALIEVLEQLDMRDLNGFRDCYNVNCLEPYTYFGIRRLSAERGNQDDHETALIMMLDDLKAITDNAIVAINMRRMELQGRLIVKWPHSPFTDDTQKVELTVTHKGRVEHALLEQRLFRRN